MLGNGLLARQNLPVRALRLGLGIAALILAAVWLTRLSAPRPVAALPAPMVNTPAPSREAAMKVFGIGGNQAALSAGIELTGIYAGGNRRSFATFRSPQGPASGVAGDQVRPGVLLQEIASDHVILRVDGAEHRLDLPARPTVPLDNTVTPN